MVLFVPDARVFYRSGVGGYSAAQTEAALHGFWMALESVASEVLAREDSPRTRAALATTFDRFRFAIYPDQGGYSNLAAQRSRELGGSTFEPPTGGIFGVASRLVGWKAARRLQRFAHGLSTRSRRSA
jgi:hypothetical protein